MEIIYSKRKNKTRPTLEVGDLITFYVDGAATTRKVVTVNPSSVVVEALIYNGFVMGKEAKVILDDIVEILRSIPKTISPKNTLTKTLNGIPIPNRDPRR